MQTRFLALSDAERATLVGSKPTVNVKAIGNVKDKLKPSENEPDAAAASVTQGSSTPSKHKKDANAENDTKQPDNDLTPKQAARPKKEKALDLEKAAKVTSVLVTS